MHRTLHLRRWQRDALDRLAASTAPDFLAVATPGAGKTTFALAAVVTHLAAAPGGRVVVVAPTQHLKAQWAQAAARVGLHLTPAWSARDGALPADLHGAVLTYQQVAADPEAVAVLARDAVVVLDEVHHAGDERAWGDGVRTAFEGAVRRLAVSGTPFRSDTSAIPFVTYVDGEAVADFTYGYGDALTDGGVVRPVYFPRVGGEMEWTAPDGSHHRHTFDDAIDRARAGQRLRTALSLDGDWLPTVLGQAHERLRQIRTLQPDAGGLVIAMDVEHARGIAGLLHARTGVPPIVATSDDPDASARIAAYATGATPWLVAVRMVSEGVDIPRLRVGVFATNTTTELFFRQAAGRLVRYTRGSAAQQAFLYLPDDPRLRTWAATVAEERRHSLRRRAERDPLLAPAAARSGSAEQGSLFSAISAVALDVDEPDWVTDPSSGPDDPEPWPALEGGDLVLELPSLPGGFGGSGSNPAGDVPAGLTRAQHHRLLRAANTERVRFIAQLTGRTHAQVNGELNRQAGIQRIAEATAAQLEARLVCADRWLRTLSG